MVKWANKPQQLRKQRQQQFEFCVKLHEDNVQLRAQQLKCQEQQPKPVLIITKLLLICILQKSLK